MNLFKVGREATELSNIVTEILFPTCVFSVSQCGRTIGHNRYKTLAIVLRCLFLCILYLEKIISFRKHMGNFWKTFLLPVKKILFP